MYLAALDARNAMTSAISSGAPSRPIGMNSAAFSAPTAEGVLYEVDMRLRPSGNKGPVATRIGAFGKYQRGEAWTWEHMALSRARLVCGEASLTEEAEAIIAARQKIVHGAVSMVQMALTELSAKQVVDLDDERRAAMVSNLMTVLCAESEVQPVINTGTLYNG